MYTLHYQTIESFRALSHLKNLGNLLLTYHNKLGVSLTIFLTYELHTSNMCESTVNNSITYLQITYNLHGLMNHKLDNFVHAQNLLANSPYDTL